MGFIAASVAGAYAAAPAPTLVYDNSQTPLNSYFASQTEFGDQINIGGGWIADTFTFEYYATGLGGGESAKVRFYRNDGVPIADGSPSRPGSLQAPGGLMYESPSFSLRDGNWPITITDLQPLGIALPDSFTWTVVPSGVAGDEVFGLKLYDPPVVGSSYDDVWTFGGGWALTQIDGVVANFGATLTAVPEPGVLSLFALGGLAMLMRRRSTVR